MFDYHINLHHRKCVILLNQKSKYATTQESCSNYNLWNCMICFKDGKVGVKKTESRIKIHTDFELFKISCNNTQA
jgi:hypothetical protein